MHSRPRQSVPTGYTADWMSGQSEANFLIQARQLRDRRVVERVEKLFSVKVTTSPAVAAAGSQQKQEERDWVNVRTSNGSSDSAEKAKVRKI